MGLGLLHGIFRARDPIHQQFQLEPEIAEIAAGDALRWLLNPAFEFLKLGANRCFELFDVNAIGGRLLLTLANSLQLDFERVELRSASTVTRRLAFPQLADLPKQALLEPLDLLAALRFTGRQSLCQTQVCCGPADQPSVQQVFPATQIDF